MKTVTVTFAAALLAATTFAAPAPAQLLGAGGVVDSLVGGEGGLIGDGGVVSFNGGGGVIDVDLGGGNTGIGASVDTNRGGGAGSTTLLDADVRLGNRGLDGNVDILQRGNSSLGNVRINDGNRLLDDLEASVNLFNRGSRSGATVDVGLDAIDDLEASLNIRIPGGSGGSEGPGNPGGPGSPGGPGGGSGVLNAGVACTGVEGDRLINIINNAGVDARSWARASSVQLVPVSVCPDVRSQVRRAASAQLGQLQGAAASDQLIAASLSRGSYSANNVFAVRQRGSQLMVYVY